METVIWLVELAVGLACLAVGGASMRVPSFRVAGIIVIVAGVAATLHAMGSLVASS